jgi:hypothetical protein
VALAFHNLPATTAIVAIVGDSLLSGRPPREYEIRIITNLVIWLLPDDSSDWRLAMAWIKTIPEKEATGELAELYRRVGHNMGLVPNILKSLSLRAEATDAVARLGSVVTFGASRLGRVREEMIATVVSSINRCHY